MAHALNWFELAVNDLPRATRFYETVLGESLKREVFDGMPMAIFRTPDPREVGGALVQSPSRKPGTDGGLIYLNAAGRLDACLDRVEQAGGAVLMPKTDIGEPGFIALVRDTEGNTVGLHSPR
jgi:predicted enzyme related to lactoylglutathione lyase